MTYDSTGKVVIESQEDVQTLINGLFDLIVRLSDKIDTVNEDIEVIKREIYFIKY